MKIYIYIDTLQYTIILAFLILIFEAKSEIHWSNYYKIISLFICIYNTN